MSQVSDSFAKHKNECQPVNSAPNHSNACCFGHSIAIALTAEAAIVATSRGFVRTFSQSGVQTGIYSVGSIVAIAGLQDLAIIIYHQGEPFEGRQRSMKWNII
jgi:hypothetical protein